MGNCSENVLYLFVLILATLRFNEMSWGGRGRPWRDKRGRISRKRDIDKIFQNCRSFVWFRVGNGENLPEEFLRSDFDLKEWLLKGKVKALTKTESRVYRDGHLGKRTSCWYNSISKHLVEEL